jgi:hypothetical protein
MPWYLLWDNNDGTIVPNGPGLMSINFQPGKLPFIPNAIRTNPNAGPPGANEVLGILQGGPYFGKVQMFP